MGLSRTFKSVVCAVAAVLGVAGAADAQVVISKVYPGGGNPGAVYISDFVELHNVSDCTVSVAGWSLQSTATGTGTAWTVASLVGSIPSGGYFLVQLATPVGFSGTQGMPFPINSSGAANLALSGGKLALVRGSVTALTGACPTGTAIVDFVGWGDANCSEGTPALSLGTDNQAELLRGTNGCPDTNNNSVDFFVGSSVSFPPRNSATAAATCSPGVTARACCNDSTGACVAYPNTVSCPAGSTVNGSNCCLPGNPCPVPVGTCCTNLFCNLSISRTLCENTGGVFLGIGVSCTVPANPCVPLPVRISQIYGGGAADAGASFASDYVELYNASANPIDLSGWSIQYATSGGLFTQRANFSDNAGSKMIPGWGYYLVRLGNGTTTGRPVLAPTADFLTSGSTQAFDMSFSSGKLALVTSANPAPNALPFCPGLPRADVADYVGYGDNSGPNCSEFSPTGFVGTSVTAFIRKGLGCIDTDNNSSDFLGPVGPNPHNSSTINSPCNAADPGACCTGTSCTLMTQGACAGSFFGAGTPCTPASTNPCTAVTGRCCRAAGACSVVDQITCQGFGDYVSWSLLGTCTTNLCMGVCCDGITCTIKGREACEAISNAYWVFNALTCSASTCTRPSPAQKGDIAYGASVSQNFDSVWQIRGTPPTRVGTWTKYDSIEFVRFDNSFSTPHNARGNLIGMNFGAAPASGATLFNLPTDGNPTSGQILFRMQAGNPLTPLNATFNASSRYAGLAISPDNKYIATVGYDNSKVLIMEYNAGSAIGTGTGASITNFWTVGNAFGFGPTDLNFAPLVSAACAWLDSTTLVVSVRNVNSNFAGGPPLGPALFTIQMGPTGPVGDPVYRVAPSDTGVDSSRVMGLAYNPSFSPYMYFSNSSFGGTTSNTLSIIDPSTWTEAHPIGFTGSCNTGREIVVGPDRYLYFTQFAGSGTTAGMPLIDRMNLDLNLSGTVTSADISALNDNFASSSQPTLENVNTTVDYYLKPSTANFTSSFVAMEIATGASHVVCCRGTTCAQVLATDCVNNIPGVGVASGVIWPCGTTNSYKGCCVADFNKNGQVTIDDIFIYLNAWFTSTPFTKVGGDGVAPPSIDDIFIFLNFWFAGCS